MRHIRSALIDFTQGYEPALRDWEVLDTSDETLMDWQIELYPVVSLQWDQRAAGRLIITPEEEDVLLLELDDGHIYGLRCPPGTLDHYNSSQLRRYLHGVFNPRTYIQVG